MYIRSRDEALDALSETLQFPERRMQIIDLSVKIIICLHPDPRQLLADSMDLLVRGTLEDMARRRQEILEAARTEDLVLIVDPEEDRLYDVLGRALDGLRLAAVAAQVFPTLAAGNLWELGRTARTAETVVRECVTDALRARGHADEADVAARRAHRLETWLSQTRPFWADRIPAVRAACEQICGPGPEAASLADVLASADDDFVLSLLGQLERSPSDALASLTQAREIIGTLRRIADEKGDPADGSARRVA